MASDPDFAKVSVLLHCDGADNSTTFTDKSPSPKTFAAYGDAKIATAQSKFGGASLRTSSGGLYLSGGENPLDMGVSDFTVECWLRPDTSAAGAIINNYGSAATSSGFVLQSNGSGVVAAYCYSGSTAIAATSAAGKLAAGVWQHLAVVRHGASFVLYLNGLNIASASVGTSVMNAAAAPMRIGMESNTGAYPISAYFDEIRVTKGVARYTANFTPPTEPFPDTALSAYASAPTPLGAPATLAASIRQAWASSQSPLGTPAILAASGESFFARAAAATPLGTPLALARAVGAARVATAGPLGAGAALGQLVAVARAAASSPLGAPAVMARTMVYAQASAPSPLGVPVVMASVLLQAQGFNSTAFGTPSSAIRLQAAGFRATSFGTPVSTIQAMPIMVGVSFGTPRSTLHTSIGGSGVPITAQARGWRNGRFGSPTALISLQVQAHGWHGARFGQPVARQTLQAAAIAPTTAFGTPAAQQQMRAQARGWQSSRFGTPLLQRRGNAEGFAATRFGTPTTKATFRAQAHGFRASAFGTPAMAWVVRALPMSPSTRFGRPARTRSTEC